MRFRILICVLLVCALPAAAQGTLAISRTRHAPDDLEVTGLLAALPPGAVGYVSYASLASLPQIATPVRDDANFAGLRVRVTGVPLEALARALGASPASDLIDAFCDDRYRAHYPADYIASHHPILGLKIDGQRIDVWAARTHRYNPGPYFITHEHFAPRYKVLAHEEEPQIPDNIVRLNFTTAVATFGSIAPHGSFPPDSPVGQGFTIAKQNCLRCHFMGAVGGTKSGVAWRALSTWASEQPSFFQKYVHHPQSVEPHAHMPANLTYDAATLAALTAYFRTFTEHK